MLADVIISFEEEFYKKPLQICEVGRYRLIRVFKLGLPVQSAD